MNPFNKRAAEQLGADVVEHYWLENVVDEAEYEERMVILLRTGRLVIPDEADLKAMEEGKWYRVSGECICSICKREYYYHPYLHKFAFVKRICDGTIVKL